MSQQKNILLLFDLPSPKMEMDDFEKILKSNPDYRDENDVIRTLRKIGHKVEPYGVFDNIRAIIEKAPQYDLTFVMCESFGNQREHAPHIVSVLEMLGVPYTGANPAALKLCADKATTKKILSFHGLRVPEFSLSSKSAPAKKLRNTKYPVIVKPLDLEASEGITAKSVVYSESEALERIRHIHKEYGVNAIIEEYIDGRELYVGMIGNKNLKAFPPRELKFGRLPKSIPRIASYRIKWDQKYKRSLYIDSRKAGKLDDKMRRKIGRTCKSIYQVLGLSGYARIDLRLAQNGELYFLEANPNPAINKKDDFAASARNGGIDYPELIQKIVTLGLTAA